MNERGDWKALEQGINGIEAIVFKSLPCRSSLHRSSSFLSLSTIFHLRIYQIALLPFFREYSSVSRFSRQTEKEVSEEVDISNIRGLRLIAVSV